MCCSQYFRQGRRQLELLACSQSYAESVEKVDSKQKCYVDSQNIEFEGKNIFVRINQEWLETNAVYTDENGFYVLEVKWPWTSFICSNCGKPNPSYNMVCNVCGTPRDD